MKYYIILRIPKDRSVINNRCLVAAEAVDDKTALCLYGISSEEDLELWKSKKYAEDNCAIGNERYGDLFDYEIMEVEL